MEFGWFILITLATCLHVASCGACDNDKSCPINEEYVTCIQGVCRAMNCSQKGEAIPCPDRAWPEEQCNAGCICKENYLRTADGRCVPEDQCEAKNCPLNEEYSNCTQVLCRALNCTQRGLPVACPGIDPDYCLKDCVCKFGFLRLQNGTCVPEDQCGVPKCGDDEVLDNCPTYGLSDYCPRSEYDNERPPTPDPCPPPACKCGFNRRRDHNGKCILTRDCPPFDCSYKPNEVYSSCPPLCPTDSCGQARLTGKCPFRIGITLECNPKCQCADGYGRYNGTCIPLGECPSICPNPNEEYKVSDIPNCPLRGLCESIVSRIVCDKPQVAACVCKDGFLRLNETSPCIPACQCPQLINSDICQSTIASSD